MNHRAHKRGFTMIELLVTMGIFLMLTGVVLTNYRAFNTHEVFASSVENLVFALRQAQVYGAGTKGGGAVLCGTPASEFDCAYGVHIPQADPSYAYKIFIDANDNRIYDAGDIDVETITWDNSIYYKTLYCGVIGISCTGNVMDITFKRPNPDAYITDSIGAPSGFGSIRINSNTTSDDVTLTITSAGQISSQ